MPRFRVIELATALRGFGGHALRSRPLEVDGGSPAEGLIVRGRKVRAPQGGEVVNSDPGRPEGKRNRNHTADGRKTREFARTRRSGPRLRGPGTGKVEIVG